jgi:hypothetical protein
MNAIISEIRKPGNINFGKSEISHSLRHAPRKRGIQYPRGGDAGLRSRGVLDRPLEPVIGRRFAPTRWRAMTANNYFAS